MFVVESKEAQADIRSQSDFEHVVQGLKVAGFTPLMATALQAMMDAASLKGQLLNIHEIFGEQHRRYQRDDQSVRVNELLPPGELFFGDHSMLMLLPTRKSRRRSYRVRAYEIRDHTKSPVLDKFCKSIQDATDALGRADKKGFYDWKPASTQRTNRQTTEERFESKAPKYSKEDLERARFCCNLEHRTLLRDISKARISHEDSLSPEVVSERVKPAMGAGLIEREFLIRCRHDNSHELAIVTSVDDAPGGMKCAKCNTPYNDELLSAVYSLSDIGQELINGSHWMTIWVTQLLTDYGVALEHIRWNARRGSDEIDIMITLSDSQSFLELKDREFGYGDAMTFAGRVNNQGGDYGLVLTTEKVNPEAKEFLEGETRFSAEMHQGPDEIAKGLERFVSRISKESGARAVAELDADLSVDLRPVVLAWMDSQTAASEGSTPERSTP